MLACRARECVYVRAKGTHMCTRDSDTEREHQYTQPYHIGHLPLQHYGSNPLRRVWRQCTET